MHQREDQPDYQSALFIFLSISLTWMFLILWALFGMGPVLIVALVMNHLITRLKVVLEADETEENRA